MITVGTAAKMAGMSRRTLARIAQQGRLKVERFTIGGHVKDFVLMSNFKLFMRSRGKHVQHEAS